MNTSKLKDGIVHFRIYGVKGLKIGKDQSEDDVLTFLKQ